MKRGSEQFHSLSGHNVASAYHQDCNNQSAQLQEVRTFRIAAGLRSPFLSSIFNFIFQSSIELLFSIY